MPQPSPVNMQMVNAARFKRAPVVESYDFVAEDFFVRTLCHTSEIEIINNAITVVQTNEEANNAANIMQALVMLKHESAVAHLEIPIFLAFDSRPTKANAIKCAKT